VCQTRDEHGSRTDLATDAASRADTFATARSHTVRWIWTNGHQNLSSGSFDTNGDLRARNRLRKADNRRLRSVQSLDRRSGLASVFPGLYVSVMDAIRAAGQGLCFAQEVQSSPCASR
jgi:hypothetical protein